MTPEELYNKLKEFWDDLIYDLEYEGEEPYANIYNFCKANKKPLVVFHYVNENDLSTGKSYTTLPDFELYLFTDKWMCRPLDVTIPFVLKMSYTDFCVTVHEVKIGGYTYPCAHTETFTPDSVDSIDDAFNGCEAHAMEKIHLMSHEWDCLLRTHHEFEEMIKCADDRTVLMQLFYIMSKLSKS